MLDSVLATQEKMRRMVLAASRGIPNKIRWNGTAVDFDWVYEAWRTKKILAETETAAFELASEHFCQRDGRPFKKRSLQVSRKFRKDFKG